MRFLLPLFLLICAATAFAQVPTMSVDPVKEEFLNNKYWSDLGKPTEGTRGFSLMTRNMQPKSDTLFEVWIKIVPNNTAAFNRRYGLSRESAYVVQLATVDCRGRTVQMEKTAAYTEANGTVDVKSSDLVKNETRSRVRAGSVSDTVYQYICLKLPS